MKVKLTKIPQEWRYRTEDGKLVGFQKCTLGKYKGKTFMCVYSESIKDTYNVTKELYWQEVLEEIKFYPAPGNKSVRILEEVEVAGNKLNRAEVFYNMARKAVFCLEGGTGFPGFTFNEHWNGWELPFFTQEVAKNFCKEFSALYCDKENEKLYYSETEDAFFVVDNNNYKEEVGHPTEIETSDGRIKVYNFGYSCWCWEETV